MPVTLLRILLPDAIDFTDTVGVLILLLEIVLVWRLTNAAIARGPFVATLIYVGMTLASLAVLVLAQGWLGLVRLP